MDPDTVPEAVRRRVATLPVAGDRWLRSLHATVTEVADRWGLTVEGSPVAGGSVSVVLRVRRTDGTPAVLKLLPPDGATGTGRADAGSATLRRAGGRGYAAVLAEDRRRGVLLLERLGAPLAASGLGSAASLEVAARVAAGAWIAGPHPEGPWPTGAEQASALCGFIERTWKEAGRPVPSGVVEAALTLAADRRDALASRRRDDLVLIHGDVHAHNVLAVPPPGDAGAPGGDPRDPGSWRLIDPEGLLSEPAHELGVILREDTPGPGEGVDDLVNRCVRLARLVAADPRATWMWACIERVSTGLLLATLDDPDAERFLSTACAVAPLSRL